MYVVDQRIEYSNGIQATVIWTAANDGHFIIEQSHDGTMFYAACWFSDEDSSDEEEVWCFVNEEDPWRWMLCEALLDLDIATDFV